METARRLRCGLLVVVNGITLTLSSFASVLASCYNVLDVSFKFWSCVFFRRSEKSWELIPKCSMEFVKNDDQEEVNSQQGIVSRCSCSCRRTKQTQEPATTRVIGGAGILTRRLRSNNNFSLIVWGTFWYIVVFLFFTARLVNFLCHLKYQF